MRGYNRVDSRELSVAQRCALEQEDLDFCPGGVMEKGGNHHSPRDRSKKTDDGQWVIDSYMADNNTIRPIRIVSSNMVLLLIFCGFRTDLRALVPWPDMM